MDNPKIPALAGIFFDLFCVGITSVLRRCKLLICPTCKISQSLAQTRYWNALGGFCNNWTMRHDQVLHGPSRGNAICITKMAAPKSRPIFAWHGRHPFGHQIHACNPASPARIPMPQHALYYVTRIVLLARWKNTASYVIVFRKITWSIWPAQASGPWSAKSCVKRKFGRLAISRGAYHIMCVRKGNPSAALIFSLLITQNIFC